ncbi:unnamed protein product [Urochloa decumbens]|uniref:Molybdenum cofactor sulfurase middle domain-containing protein n=1 Tax=Urochloa decumbens TaxID=240449 RepID=A0ABC9D5X0_9POAL
MCTPGTSRAADRSEAGRSIRASLVPVVNSQGRGRTQRVEPKLALIQVELPFAEDWQPTPDDHMVIRAPGMDPLKIPLASECATIYDVSVWEWSGSAYDEGSEAAQWFSTFFGNPTRLVRFKEESETRLTDPEYARGYKTMFSDGFPFLITSQGSLDALNEILKEPIPIKSLQTKVPTIDQDTGIPSPTEPTETLQTYRSGEVLLSGHKNKRQVYFGQNAVCKECLSANGQGRMIKVGDPVYVMRSFSSSNEVPA